MTGTTLGRWMAIDLGDRRIGLALSDPTGFLATAHSVMQSVGRARDAAAIVEIAERHDAWVMVDEAHSTGVFGPGGAGLVAALGLGDRVDVRMGTLGTPVAWTGAAFVLGLLIIPFAVETRGQALPE